VVKEGDKHQLHCLVAAIVKLCQELHDLLAPEDPPNTNLSLVAFLIMAFVADSVMAI
jgi:hypothetical protein